MKKLPSYCVLTLLLVFLIACNETETKSKEKLYAANLDQVHQVDSLRTHRFAYIKEFEMLNSELLLTVDYVDYLTGKAAMEAEWRDKAYFIDGTDTISKITDGYYISNINPKLRTFKVKENIAVAHVIDDDGEQKLPEPKQLDVKQIETYIKNETLVFLHIKHETIVRIDERFMP